MTPRDESYDETQSMHRDVPEGPSTASEQLSAMPKQIGQYELLEIIGYGGMGVVYKAMQPHPKREVAIKVLRFEQMSERRLRRFELEGELLGRLNHQALAKVYEVGFFDAGQGRQPFIAMEYIKADHLVQYVEQQLDIRETLELMLAICEGVAYAHQQGIVHRDLKPSNILVTDEGKIRILDFGVASASDPELQLQTMQTDAGQMIGTLPYMSPEQAAGLTDEVDTLSDVYSVGVIAYRLLSGNLPHDVKSLALPQAVEEICNGLPKLLGFYDKIFTGDIETIVAKALEKDKNRRYQSVSAFAADISRYLKHEPVEARPPSLFYALSRFAKRNTAAVVASATILFILISATVFSSYKAIDANIARQKSDERLQQIQSVASTLVFDLTDRVGNIPGATPLREYIAMTGLRTLRLLEEEVANNDSLAIELARAWQRLGDIFGNPHVANLGRTQDAVEAYFQAERLLEETAIASQLDYAEVHRRIADMFVLKGHTDLALNSYQQAKKEASASTIVVALLDGRIASMLHLSGDTGSAVAMLRTAVARLENYENAEDVVLLLVKLSAQLAELEKTVGNSADAADILQKALGRVDQLVNNRPNDQSLLELQAGIELNLGESLLQEQEIHQAVIQLKHCTKIYEQLLQIDPLNVRMKEKWAIAQRHLAKAYSSNGQIDLAIDTCKLVIQKYRQMIKVKTSNAANLGLANTLSLLGSIQTFQGLAKDAVVSIEEAVALLQKLAEEDTDDTSLLAAVAKTTIQYVESVGKATGDHEQAAEQMVPQLALLESLSESNSENIELRIAIISVHTNLYSLYMQAGEPEKSLQYALLNIENARDITERDPDKVSANRILSNVISQAGDAQSKLGRDDEARVNFDRAIAILLELVTKHPDDSQLMRSLSFEYNKIGDMLRRQGDYQGAKNYYVSCREIDTNLVFLDESNLGWICDLAISNQRVAEACALLGESADAVDSFETALHHLNKLHQVKPDSSYIERLCISTSGRYAEYLFTIGDFQGALIQGELARDRAAVLRESVGDKPYDLTLWAGLESLVGRALFNDAMQSDGSIKNELLENALLALNNTLQVLEQMEREGISKSYNNKLYEDMLIARDEVVQAIEQVN